jgi:hypothetical protein
MVINDAILFSLVLFLRMDFCSALVVTSLPIRNSEGA